MALPPQVKIFLQRRDSAVFQQVEDTNRFTGQFRLEGSSGGPTSCSQLGHFWGQTRLLKAWSSQGLKPSKDEDCTTFQAGQPVPLTDCPHIDKIILVSSVNFSWLCLLSLIFLQYTTAKSMVLSSRQSYRHWQAAPKPVGLPKDISAPGWTSPVSPVSPHRSSAGTHTTSVASTECTKCLSCMGKPKTGCSISDTI